ncbi:unknown [Firmicutes bacterium CAG:238]|nr:unknown [Firmicutes bacterium CAG:238]
MNNQNSIGVVLLLLLVFAALDGGNTGPFRVLRQPSFGLLPDRRILQRLQRTFTAWLESWARSITWDRWL